MGPPERCNFCLPFALLPSFLLLWLLMSPNLLPPPSQPRRERKLSSKSQKEAPAILNQMETQLQISKGSSSNTKSNGSSSLPILNQMETQFQISKGSSSNTKPNGSSSLPILNQMETHLNWISRYNSRCPHCWGGGPPFTNPDWTLRA